MANWELVMNVATGDSPGRGEQPSRFSLYNSRLFLYPSVKKVVPKGDYRLAIEFDNGESGILDMKPYLEFGIFQRLKDPNAFKRVRVSFDTVEWDSGIDLDPEFVPTSRDAGDKSGSKKRLPPGRRKPDGLGVGY